LTPQQVIDWFEKDSKIRREQGSDAAFLKWWLGTATPLIPSCSQGGNLWKSRLKNLHKLTKLNLFK
jgi:hypothetical protein